MRGIYLDKWMGISMTVHDAKTFSIAGKHGHV